jgi:hypothetical protein
MQRNGTRACCCCICRLGKLHKKLDVLIKLFISSLDPSQALMLSRQATLGHAAGGATPAGRTGIRSSFQASSPHWQQGRGIPAGSMGMHGMPALNLNAGTPGGPGFLRHAMSALGQLPEQLEAVSGPLMGAVPHLGGHHGAGVGPERGLARRSGPPGLWGAAGGATSPTERHTSAPDVSATMSRAGSGTAGMSAAAATAALRASYGSRFEGRQAHPSEQQSPWVDDLRGSSFSGGSGTSGMYTGGFGHIGPMLSQLQALQLLSQQHQEGYTAAQLARARLVRLNNGRGGLARSNSL